MNRAHQHSTNRPNFPPSKRGMVYIPPPTAAIDEYSKEVCQQLGQTVDPAYDTTEMRVELTAFIKVVFESYAKYLTKQRNAGSSSTKKEDEETGGKNESVQTA